MEELRKLVENFLEYTCTISITDSELYEKYYDKLSQIEKDYLTKKGKLDNEIERMIKADILYDFLFTPINIIEQIECDINAFGEDSSEFIYIKQIYKEIQKVFFNFKIERLEEE